MLDLILSYNIDNVERFFIFSHVNVNCVLIYYISNNVVYMISEKKEHLNSYEKDAPRKLSSCFVINFLNKF